MHTRTTRRLQILLALLAIPACAGPEPTAQTAAMAPETRLDCRLTDLTTGTEIERSATLFLWGGTGSAVRSHAFRPPAAATEAAVSTLDMGAQSHEGDASQLIAYSLRAGAPYYVATEHMEVVEHARLPDDGKPFELETLRLDIGAMRLALGCALTSEPATET